MTRQPGSDDRRSRPMLIGEPVDDPIIDHGDKPRIESDGRYAKPNEEQPPDPRAVIEDLRRKLRAEQEKSLNAVDAVMGARAAAAQAKAETQETFYRLHVRETELNQLKELLVGRVEPAAGSSSTAIGSQPNHAEQAFGGPVRSVAYRHMPNGPLHEQSVAANASNTARSLLAAAKRMVAE